MKNTQQEIPFKLEGNTASRDNVRAISKNADGLRKISLDLIRIRPGFNARQKPSWMTEDLWEIELGIPDLADGIYASGGPAEPLLGDIYQEDGCFYITNGERRSRALRHLVATSREIYPNSKDRVDEVRILLNPTDTTDLDRKRKVISTQDNMKLKPMQKAHFILSFKTENEMSHQQIADLLSMSRQNIDNYITACELPAEIQDAIDRDEIKLTNAIGDLRKGRKEAKKGGIATVDLDSGEILTESQENRLSEEQKEKDKLRGDEEEFITQDNSISSAGSRGGPKEEGSGAVVIGKDSIYMDAQKLALWKVLVNRYEVLKRQILLEATLKNEYLTKWEDILAERLKNEYNLTVK